MNKYWHNDDTGSHKVAYMRMTMIPAVVARVVWLTVAKTLTNECE